MSLSIAAGQAAAAALDAVNAAAIQTQSGLAITNVQTQTTQTQLAQQQALGQGWEATAAKELDLHNTTQSAVSTVLGTNAVRYG